MKELHVFKIGGGIIADSEQMNFFLKEFSRFKGHKILVHGGGRGADVWLKKLNVTPQMIEGRRITDSDTLEIIIMHYAGLTNKSIVVQLQAYNTNAIGLSGVDGNALKSTLRPVGKIDYGWVGDLTPQGINTHFINKLLNDSCAPVFCAITHDGKGQLLNTNADSIAAQISIAFSSMYEVTLHFCFDQLGVMEDIDDENSLIEKINHNEYLKLKDNNIISGGMIPKLDYAFDVLKNPVKAVILEHPKQINTSLKTVLCRD